MALSADFLDFLQDQLRGLGRITSRRMFSGAGLYCEGVIFALILRDTLYFKAEGLEPFSYEASGQKRTVGAYWQIPERLFDDPDEMLEWARGALAAGRRAEALKKRKPRSHPGLKALPRTKR